MTQTTISRSVLETPTIEFKQHFREYLKVLAKDINTHRVELIDALEWCFDRWEYWRQKFYPDADLMFPFFQSAKNGSEFGHYSTCGASGQPSVIHIKRSFLMGTADITVCKISKTRKLVLKADHPDRLKFVDQTILHELVHQYLCEASPDALAYEATELGSNRYKGHGPLFAAECNRINRVLHPELGFEFVPVRHSKRSHAKVADVQRPSCAQFTHGELFWCWDIRADDLTWNQVEENRRRLEQALAFYGGAVELIDEAEEVETTFEAPFAADCADVCIQKLKDWDKANGSNLLDLFVQAVLDHAGASSDAPVNIPPVSREQMELTVPTSGDGPVSMADAYPLDHPALSLLRLTTHIKESGLTKAGFAEQRFGHKNGQQLSRHLKKLRTAQELVAA